MGKTTRSPGRKRESDYAESWPMTARQFSYWRKRVGRRTKVRFWGQTHWVTPRLCELAWGDGRKVIGVTPIDTRPNYYLVRVDSKTELDPDEGPSFRDILDDVLDALEDQYGPSHDEDGESLPWPAADMSNGVSWWEWRR